MDSLPLPWWAHAVSVTLSVVVVPLAGVAFKNWRQLKRIRNGGSGLLDIVVKQQAEIMKVQGALVEAQTTINGEIERLRQEKHDLREQVLTPMMVSIAKLDERTSGLGERVTESWKMIDKMLLPGK